MKTSILLVALILSMGCASHAPATLTPTGVVVWQANEVAVGVGLVQTAAINLNKVQVCDPLPCHPLLSDANTRVVVDAVTDGIQTLKAVPAGWKATGTTIVDRIDQRLDTAGQSKLKAYTAAVRAIIGGL